MMVQVTGEQIRESHALLQQTSESIRDVGEFINSIKDNTGRLSTNIKAAATAFERLDNITGRIESFSTKFEKASAMLAQSHHESQQELKTLVSEYLTPMKHTVEDAKALQDGLIEPVRNQNVMLGQLLADAREYEAMRIQLMEAAKDVRSAFSALADQQKNALESVGNRILTEQKGLYEEVAGGFKYLKEGPIQAATSNLTKSQGEIKTALDNLERRFEEYLRSMDRQVQQREAHNKVEISALSELAPALRDIKQSASNLVDPEGDLKKTLMGLTNALAKMEQGRGSVDELKTAIQELKNVIKENRSRLPSALSGSVPRPPAPVPRIVPVTTTGTLPRATAEAITQSQQAPQESDRNMKKAAKLAQHYWYIGVSVVVLLAVGFLWWRNVDARAAENKVTAARAVIDSVKAVPGIWTHAFDSLLVAEANMITARTQLAEGDDEGAVVSLESAVSAARGAIPAAQFRAMRADAENEINGARRAVKGAWDALAEAWRGGPRPGLRDSLRTAVSNLEAAENGFAEGDFPKAQESASSAARVANEVNAYASTPHLGRR